MLPINLKKISQLLLVPLTIDDAPNADYASNP